MDVNIENNELAEVRPITRREQALTLWWRMGRSYIATLSIIEIAATSIGMATGGAAERGIQAALLPFEIVVFARAGMRASREQKKSWQDAAVFGAFIGTAFGVVMAAFKVAVVWQTWTLFNIITEPGLTAIAGGLISGASGAFQNRRKKRSDLVSEVLETKVHPQ